MANSARSLCKCALEEERENYLSSWLHLCFWLFLEPYFSLYPKSRNRNSSSSFVNEHQNTEISFSLVLPYLLPWPVAALNE